MNQAQYNTLCRLLTEVLSRPGGSCDDPIFFTSCDAPADQITVDTELFCDTVTGFYNSHTTTTTNGVAADPVVTPTTFSCAEDEPPPDVEQVRICDETTGTVQIVTSAFTEGEDPVILSSVDTNEECTKQVKPECVESQEWTYGLDNAGTSPLWDATYEVTLSDGSTLSFTQTNQGAANAWTAQIDEWGANIQAAADAAGLQWFVDTRYMGPAPGDSVAGGAGLPGPPSPAVGVELYNGGMRFRYINIQVCPGQPVPVAAHLVSLDAVNGAPVTRDPGYGLTTAGAVLGPIRKFWVCLECGEAPVWYLEDGVTLAGPDEMPNCWEPCGTLSLLPSPPDRECEYFFDLGCDNDNQTDPANFVGQITRRGTVCAGEQVAVDYFTEDPADATSLIDYQLVGDFVDCDTGEPITTPEPEGCAQIEQCWEGELTPSQIGPNTALDGAGFDYGSVGATYNLNNSTGADVVLTNIDIDVLDGTGSEAQITVDGVKSNVIIIGVDGVYRFTLSAPVTVPDGESVRLLMGGDDNVGNWRHAEADSQHPWLGFDTIAISLYTDGGIVSYNVIVCPDGTTKAYDSLGNEAPFNPNGDWLQIECVNDSDLLQQIADNTGCVKKRETCYERTYSLVNTDSIEDTGQAPITNGIVIIPDETGEITGITIRVNNANGPPTQELAVGIPVAIQIGGVTYEFNSTLSGLDSSLAAPWPSDPGHIPPGRFELYFLTPGLQATAGQPIVINSVNDGSAPASAGDPTLVEWSTNNTDDGGQVQPFNDGTFAQVTLFGTITERFSVCEFVNGDTVILGPDGSEIDELPADAEQVRCDKICDTAQPADGTTESTHLIEGCIDGDPIVDINGDPVLDENGDRTFEPVSAYTIVDANGDPLFEPRPLTDAGFRAGGCC